MAHEEHQANMLKHCRRPEDIYGYMKTASSRMSLRATSVRQSVRW